MKVVLIGMPNVIPIVIHEMAVHMPNHGIACAGLERMNRFADLERFDGK